MTTATLNGMPRASSPQRKSLAHQLDRMDQILDGLSDGLSAAVVDAVKDAVGQAVQVALREVLTHPGVVARLAVPQPAANPAPAPAPTRAATKNGGSWVTRLGKGVWIAVRSRVTQTYNRLRDSVGQTHAGLKIAVRRAGRVAGFCLKLAKTNLRTVVMALAIGVATGAACYYAGPVAAAAVTGIVTALLAVVARLLSPFAGLLFSGDA